jgi:hypothetical protein
LRVFKAADEDISNGDPLAAIENKSASDDKAKNQQKRPDILEHFYITQNVLNTYSNGLKGEPKLVKEL